MSYLIGAVIALVAVTACWVIYRLNMRFLNIGTKGITKFEETYAMKSSLLLKSLSALVNADEDSIEAIQALQAMIDKHEEYYHADLSDMKAAIAHYNYMRDNHLGVLSHYMEKVKALPKFYIM